MSRIYKFYEKTSAYFIRFATVNWIDIYTRDLYFCAIIEPRNFCRKNKGLELYAYVIRNNHIHLIARAKEGYVLSEIIRDFKKFIAKEILNEIQIKI